MKWYEVMRRTESGFEVNWPTFVLSAVVALVAVRAAAIVLSPIVYFVAVPVVAVLLIALDIRLRRRSPGSREDERTEG